MRVVVQSHPYTSPPTAATSPAECYSARMNLSAAVPVTHPPPQVVCVGHICAFSPAALPAPAFTLPSAAGLGFGYLRAFGIYKYTVIRVK